jgi:hypothetical protein
LLTRLDLRPVHLDPRDNNLPPIVVRDRCLRKELDTGVFDGEGGREKIETALLQVVEAEEMGETEEGGMRDGKRKFGMFVVSGGEKGGAGVGVGKGGGEGDFPPRF